MSIMEREVIGTLWKWLYIAVLNFSVFNASVAKPPPCIVFGVGLVLYNLIQCFNAFEFIPTITLNFCLHSTYNIRSKVLVYTIVFVTLKTRGKMGRVNFRKDVWDCYWLLLLLTVTTQESIAGHISAPVPFWFLKCLSVAQFMPSITGATWNVCFAVQVCSYVDRTLLHFSKTRELWCSKATLTITFFAAVNHWSQVTKLATQKHTKRIKIHQSQSTNHDLLTPLT